MAEEDKQGTHLSAGIIVAAVVTAGVYYFNHKAPLVDLRPDGSTSIQEQTSARVDARLWQDPIAAVEQQSGKMDGSNPKNSCQGESTSDDELCKPPSLQEAMQVLAVTVPGGPYQEEAEERRRIRYAILSGLEQAGYTPDDPQHLNYFIWARKLASVQPAAALESPFFCLRAQDNSRHAEAGKSDCQPPDLTAGLQYTRPSARSAVGDSIVVPYETFGKTPKTVIGNPFKEHVLIVWLREDALMQQPFTKLSSLLGDLRGATSTKVKVIGPFSSNLLMNMASEVSQSVSCSQLDESREIRKWQNLKDVAFYAYGASAPDTTVLGTAWNCATLQHLFNQLGLGITFQRTVATDDRLADGLLSELKRRGYDNDNDKDPDYVALISEWDTVYGRTLREFFESYLKPKFTENGNRHVLNFTYLKGLDGLLPSNGRKKDESKGDKQGDQEKQGDPAHFFKAVQDAESLERPIGQSQFDYLRRLSDQLHKEDDNIRQGGLKRKDRTPQRIAAIGILGGDVFDKLLILRALKPGFPEALFFTTDFDQAYTIKSELPYTRNLIIASSFGPRLSGWLQGDIPEFRDNYETAAFLATEMALGLASKTQPPDYLVPGGISAQLKEPRLFEVKRSGGVLSFAWTPPSEPRSSNEEPHGSPPYGALTAQNSSFTKRTAYKEDKSLSGVRPEDAPSWACQEKEGHVNCNNIQPVDPGYKDDPGYKEAAGPKPVEELFPTFNAPARKNLTLFLGLAAVATLGLWPWAARRRTELILIFAGLTIAAIIWFEWEPLARFFTSAKNNEGNLIPFAGEPIALMDGTSLWPTVILRVIGMVLSFYFIWRALRDLQDNLKDIATDLDLNLHPAPLWDQLMFKKRNGELKDPSNKHVISSVDQAWTDYVRRERLWHRASRAAVWTGLMFAVLWFVFVPLLGRPVYGHRSEIADSAYELVALLFWFPMQFLTFVVFDATWSCLQVIRKLRKQEAEKHRHDAQWPPQTLSVYNGRMSLYEVKLIHEWIDLEFVGKRTRCIGSLIYLPFILIALLIVSRSAIFANYAPSVTILASALMSLSIVFASAVILWWTANSARDTVRSKLKEVIIRLKKTNIYSAGQVESLLLRIDELKDGAFGPLRQQPLVKALLFPLSSAGWIALIENGVLPGF